MCWQVTELLQLLNHILVQINSLNQQPWVAFTHIMTLLPFIRLLPWLIATSVTTHSNKGVIKTHIFDQNCEAKHQKTFKVAEATARGAEISRRIPHSETSGVDIADFEAAAAHLDLPAKMLYGRVNTSDGRGCRSLKESGGVILPIRTVLPPEAAVAASPLSFISLGHLRGFPVLRAMKKNVV